MEERGEQIQLVPAKRRVVAFVIDDLVVSFLFIAIFWSELITLTTAEEINYFLTSNFLVIVSIKITYQTIFIWQNGMTLGKYATKMRVVSQDYGEIPSFNSSLLRAVGRIVSETLFYIGFLMAFFNPMVQTFHDRLSKSVVIDA
jgi:uncharacterized RDD family membrane protein YckC